MRRETLSLPTDLDQEQFLYLTTRGRKSGRPRQIEIWFTHRKLDSEQDDARFYIIAEYETSQWVGNIRHNSAVEVRVSNHTFPATARIISPKTEGALHHGVQELSRKKYGWGEGLVVELIPNMTQPEP